MYLRVTIASKQLHRIGQVYCMAPINESAIKSIYPDTEIVNVKPITKEFYLHATKSTNSTN